MGINGTAGFGLLFLLLRLLDSFHFLQTCCLPLICIVLRPTRMSALCPPEERHSFAARPLTRVLTIPEHEASRGREHFGIRSFDAPGAILATIAQREAATAS